MSVFTGGIENGRVSEKRSLSMTHNIPCQTTKAGPAQPTEPAETGLYLLSPHFGESMLFELQPDERRAFIKGFFLSASIMVTLLALFTMTVA